MNNQESEIEQIISMSQQRVDMILQAGGGADEVAPNPAYVSVINRIQKKTPVIVTSDICNLSCFRIVADDDEGMKQALQYLFSLGHKAIALVVITSYSIHYTKLYEATLKLTWFSTLTLPS